MRTITEAGAAPTSPSAALAALDVEPRELANAYVLGRSPEIVARLAGRVERVLEPFDVVDGLRPGDLLVRSIVGEGASVVSLLVRARGRSRTRPGRSAGRSSTVVTAGMR